MKSTCLLLALLSAYAPVASAGDPLAKVLGMIDDLTAKITKEGEAEDKAYVAFFEWCDDTCANLKNEIKTGNTKTADLTAAIEKLTSDISDSTVKIDELVAALAKDSKELKEATAIRDREHADFNSEEAELLEGVDTLDRAIGIIEKALAKNPGAFAQIDTNNVNGLLKAIGTMMDAASVSSMSKQKLLAMVQRAKSDSDDEDAGAPAGAVYESKAGGIVDVLEDMKEKAEEQLQGLRQEETTSANNFAMLKQSLEDSMAADNKDLDDEKSARSAANEEKATAEGDLQGASKALAEAEKELTSTQSNCMQTAADHDASVKARAEELKVIAEAKKILEESTGGAAVGEAVSLFQIREGVTKKGIANSEVIALVKQLAKKHRNPALNQLASKIAATVKFGAASGEDPFEKIRGLITDMIAKLTKEADEDANEKAYCDEQMAKTEAKKVNLDDTIESLTSKIDKSIAKSTGLKEEVKVLQEELATLAKEQKALDNIRSEQHAAYVVSQKELSTGLAGVRKALEMLRKYYGGSAFVQTDMAAVMEQPKVPMHSSAGGAGSGIISMLEVCESDISKSLSAVEKEESDEAAEYESTTQENQVATTEKTQDVKYKTQEHTALDKSVADLSADRDTAEEEHAAVMSYYDKVKDRCVAKPESYAEIKARRDAEIKGLQEALSVLEGSFAQTGRHARHHHFLGF